MMIIYNVTTHVEGSIETAWIEYMREKHIPLMLATGKFREATFTRINPSETTEQGLSFSVQYLCPNKATLESYLAEDAERIERELLHQFGSNALEFATELELIGRAQLNTKP
jgi:hypothetical protein